MAAECFSRMPHHLALTMAASALALLGGCVVAPVGPYEVGAPVVYSDGYAGTTYGTYGYGGYPYGSTTIYHYGSPYDYYGLPPVSLGFHGYWSDRDRARSPGWRGRNPPPPRWNNRPGPAQPPGGYAGPRRPPGTGNSDGRPPRIHGHTGVQPSRAMPELSRRELPPPSGLRR